MSNIVVTDGDTLVFDTAFAKNIVVPIGPCLINGGGESNIMNKNICVSGDEFNVSIEATYTDPAHLKPGTGIITIAELSADQLAVFAMSPVPVIVVGSQFSARFTPTSPATDPSGNPDPDMVPTLGTGKFINSQSFVTAG